MPILQSRPAVYLAGPAVFEPDPEAIFTLMKRVCDRHGLQGISPLDNQLALQGAAPGRALAHRIVEADIALMRRLDAGVFCLDGFRRGPEMDPGTAFEVGYMHALGKPLAGWTRDPRDYPDRVRDFFADVFGLGLAASIAEASTGTGTSNARLDGLGLAASTGEASATGARSGARRDPDGVLVHSEGCVQNAMVHAGLELGGGAVFADVNWLSAFEAAVAHLAARLAPAAARGGA